MKRKKRDKTTALTPGCVIPKKPDDETLRSVLLDRPMREERETIEYVEWQLSKGAETKASVLHLEKVKTERVFGRDYDLWDVHTTAGRWWVVSNPRNVYPQDQFPSADYMLSFHVGLSARLAQRDHRQANSSNVTRFTGAYRRWEQAAQGVDSANEAEDFQAVGMKCRECLLTFTRAAQTDVKLPKGTPSPKRGDFVSWSAHIADWAAPGEHSKDMRRHLKDVAASAWQLASWLTHSRNAFHTDAELVVDAVRHVLDSFTETLVRRESKRPERCPKCSSYQVESIYAPELAQDPPYMISCGACGWEEPTRLEC